MEKLAIYLGSIVPFKNMEITIIGETPKFYKYRIKLDGLTPRQRRRLWSSHYINTHGRTWSGKVSKKLVQFKDILSDDMFTI